MDFLKNLKISDDHDDQKPAAASHQDPAPGKDVALESATAPKHEGLFHKIGDALKGEHKTAAPAPPPPAPKEENLLDKLGSALSGDDHKAQPASPPPAPKHEGVLGKLGDALGHLGHHGKPAPPPEPKKTDLLSKIGDTISGKKEVPPKPQGLLDKVNSALGGGAAAEAKEGKLDKAIDLVQEHVLKEGPQHNESALEQAKDRQIADTIRKFTGLEKHETKN